MSNKKPTLPYTFSTFKGNIHWTFHNYMKVLIFCTNSTENYVNFLHRYRFAQKEKSQPVQFALPGQLRILRDKPFLARWANSHVHFTEGIDTLCTYNTSVGQKGLFAILDESRVPQDLLSGYYTASIKIKTTPSFWNQKYDESSKTNSPYAEFSMVQAEILVTLEEYVGPFEADMQQHPRDLPSCDVTDEIKPFPKTLSAFWSDFKSIFKI